jgi:hypothetical protein
MELLTEAIRNQLPPLYSQQQEKDPMVWVKFFHPLANLTWYAIEFDGDDLFYGWVHSDSPEPGYFSLSEMQEVQVLGLGMERDLYFTPKRLSEVKKLYGL